MSFSSKLTIAFVAVAVLAALTAVMLIVSLRQVSDANDHVFDVQTTAAIEGRKLESLSNRMVASARGFQIVPDQRFSDRFKAAEKAFAACAATLRALDLGDKGQELLRRVEEKSRAYIDGAADEVLSAKVGTQADQADHEAIASTWFEHMVPPRDALDQAIFDFEDHVLKAMGTARSLADSRESLAIGIASALTGITIALSLALAFWLRRSLSKTIASTVQHLQSASGEIDAASGEQATSTREQHTAIIQVTSTINELLATSKRILENTQRVANIAVKTEGTAKDGVRIGEDGVVAMAAIRAQTDAIVANMIDLSRRCQQIGAVVDVINELTEQTTILAINASIEAIGAGEAGNRFAAVADEIRRLAERVRTSTRDIRGHVEGVRSGANAMVLSTEEGAKTVTAGAARQTEVGRSFETIASLVHSALDDAREIELSAKQQSTAVEQVSSAVTEVGAAARQAENATRRMQTAATDLADLARDLRQKIV